MNLPSPAPAARPRRPRFQFTVLGLLVLMLAASMIGAMLYYFFRGWETGQSSLRLVGMVGMLAGPLLLTILVSLLVLVAQWLGRK